MHRSLSAVVTRLTAPAGRASSFGLVILAASTAHAAIIAPNGYIYSTIVLGSPTQSCVAAAPSGTFVGVGLGFTANAQAVVQVSESGSARLVAFGFNSISDCAYDAASDTLYVGDNAAAGDTPGAATGDTVFRIANASTASAQTASGLELLPANSIASAAGLAVTGSGDVLAGNALGVGTGTVDKLTLLPTPALSPLASPFDFVGGIAIDPATGNILVAQSLASFESRIDRYSPAGLFIDTLAGPSYGFGSYDLAYSHDGLLLATGSGTVMAFNSSGTPTPFATGFSFATGISTDPTTGRVEILDSFSFSASDRSVHRFTPVSKLLPGGTQQATECLHEVYGVDGTPCTDGAACDADGAVNGSCLFPVGLCLRVSDPRFPECGVEDISALTIKTSPASAETTALAARVAAALPITASSCFFGDGLRVPVKTSANGAKPGKGAVKVKVQSISGKKDSDSVRLVCQPAP